MRRVVVIEDVVFFFNARAPTEIYTLSLHDALPIWRVHGDCLREQRRTFESRGNHRLQMRSEEHTSELQSQSNLVCRLLLEKKNKIPTSGSTQEHMLLGADAFRLSCNQRRLARERC